MPTLEMLADLWIKRKVRHSQMTATALRPVVVVTGGSRGLGRELAECFARHGHDVVLVARNPAQLAAATAGIEAATGKKALAVALDICAQDCATVLDRRLTEAGCYMDVLVNNAGLGAAGPFAEAGQDTLGKLIATNIDAATRLCRYFLPAMLARGRGGILNVASLGGAIPGPGQSAYYASKAYILSLTEALAAECSGLGLRICVLAPGPLNTDFHKAMQAEGSPYRALIPAVSLRRTARAAYWGYSLGRKLIVPGLVNRALYTALRFLPHPVSVPFVRILLQKQ